MKTNKIKVNPRSFDFRETRRDQTPFYWKLPNVGKVNIIKGKYHQWLSYFNIFSYKDDRQVLLEGYDKGQRYLKHVERRLVLLSKSRDSQAYWKFSTYIIQHSRFFFVWGLRSIDLNWARKLSKGKTIRIWRKVQTIFSKLETKIEQKRVWIQSPPGKIRGLSVPTLEWRITGAIMTRFMEIWLTPVWDPQQHAYLSRWGCGTAWRAFKQILFPKKNILEFDLKKFFPTVSHYAIRVSLTKRDVSTVWINWISLMLKSASQLPSSLVITELVHGGPNMHFKSRAEQLYHAYEPEYHRVRKDVGVSMGFSLSPILAVITLHDSLLRLQSIYDFVEWVIYADDGILGWDYDVSATKILKAFDIALKPSYPPRVGGESRSKYRKVWTCQRERHLAPSYQISWYEIWFCD